MLTSPARAIRRFPQPLARIIGSIPTGLDNTRHSLALAIHPPHADTAAMHLRLKPGPARAARQSRIAPRSDIIPAAVVSNYDDGLGLAFGPADLWTFYDETPLLDAGINGGAGGCVAVVEDTDYYTPSVALFDTKLLAACLQASPACSRTAPTRAAPATRSRPCSISNGRMRSHQALPSTFTSAIPRPRLDRSPGRRASAGSRPTTTAAPSASATAFAASPPPSTPASSIRSSPRPPPRVSRCSSRAVTRAPPISCSITRATPASSYPRATSAN